MSLEDRSIETCSETMWRSGQGGGGYYVHCACGIDHEYDEDSEGYLHYINLDGVPFVEGCQGCESKLARYERFIWENREHIRTYLKMRVDQEKLRADQEKTWNILADID